jgi:hypothetical protein
MSRIAPLLDVGIKAYIHTIHELIGNYLQLTVRSFFQAKNELHSPFAGEKTVFFAYRVIVIRHKGKHM